MKIILIALTCVHLMGLSAQKKLDILFYNVENLFDFEDDSLKNDEEFLPDGERHWNYYRYTDKLNNIGKSILACSEWGIPGLIGLCEIENRRTIHDLIYNSPLKALNYKAIHRESNDQRGIDVALLYQSKQFHLITTNFYRHPDIQSRDILYAKGTLARNDTVHVFVNHWPSRYGGAVRSDPFRISSAQLLRSKVDSIQSVSPGAMILIMGDFNDYAHDVSLYDHLQARESGSLVNMSLYADKSIGSYKMTGRWGYLDQFIITENIWLGDSEWKVNPRKQIVAHPSFLMEEDLNFPGLKPKRSWIGYQYQDGFSDHLPVLLHLQKR